MGSGDNSLDTRRQYYSLMSHMNLRSITNIKGFDHGWELSLRWTVESLSAGKLEKEKNLGYFIDIADS